MTKTSRLAVIDVGSNTVRLLIVEGNDKNYKILEQAQEITRLGQGLSEGKPFLPAACQRTLATLQTFCELARKSGAATIWALGTSAMRRASNAQEFIAEVKRTCGLQLQVVSGTDEARITLQGLESVIPPQGGQYLTIDIGGGSTEFILADGKGGILNSHSIELGAVSMTERFLTCDPPAKEEFAQLSAYLQRQLSPILVKYSPVTRLLGTAGTITTLAAVAQQMRKYDSDKINGFVLERSRIASMLDAFSQQPLARRRQVPGLEPKRADIIIAGTLILLVSMQEAATNRIIVSDAGFREGIVVELFKKAIATG